MSRVEDAAVLPFCGNRIARRNFHLLSFDDELPEESIRLAGSYFQRSHLDVARSLFAKLRSLGKKVLNINKRRTLTEVGKLAVVIRRTRCKCKLHGWVRRSIRYRTGKAAKNGDAQTTSLRRQHFRIGCIILGVFLTFALTWRRRRHHLSSKVETDVLVCV